MRALTLLIIEIGNGWRRLRYDLGRELSVALATGILLATFAYVFDDFLNVQIAELSAAMRDRVARGCGAITLLALAITAGLAIRRERLSLGSVFRWALRCGEERAIANHFRILRMAVLVTMFHGGAWLVVERWMMPPLGQADIVTALTMLVATGVAMFIPAVNKRDVGDATPLPADSAPLSAPTLRRWHALALLHGRPFRICVVATAITSLMIPIVIARGAPPFLPFLLALAGGLALAAAIHWQFADDLRSAWLEKAAGVSHKEYMNCYQHNAMAVACISGGLTFAFVIGADWLSGAESETLTTPIVAAKVAIAAALPPFLAPQMALQIDGRRGGTGFMITFVLSLFLATAVFAHGLSLLLIPLLKYYADQVQQGRFYRA